MQWFGCLQKAIGALATSSNRDFLARLELLEPIPLVISDQSLTEAEAHQQSPSTRPRPTITRAQSASKV